MRRISLLGLSALIVWSLSCSDGTGVEEDDLVGTWDATQLEFTEKANVDHRVDLIANGWTFAITLDQDGTYDAILDAPDGPPEAITGVWEATIDVFRMKDDTEPWWQEFDLSLSGTTLTLTGGDLNFDFGGGDVEASLDMVLVKR